ncbi:unnamed protein product [Pleuronectes platessa]|uniref:Uncharacterized protein n=1 Tax=Pleuronectes platessa TaxID=8262 RepID=A0A9N7VAG6_PLEPL|nr:unnamed protein product [Pleuronectes platessa]
METVLGLRAPKLYSSLTVGNRAKGLRLLGASQSLSSQRKEQHGAIFSQDAYPVTPPSLPPSTTRSAADQPATHFEARLASDSCSQSKLLEVLCDSVADTFAPHLSQVYSLLTTSCGIWSTLRSLQ